MARGIGPRFRAIVAQGPHPACRSLAHVGQGWKDGAMNRDPMCTNGHGDALTADCSMCALIAKVRADERKQAVQRVKDFQTEVLSGLSFYPMGDYMDGLIEKAICGEQP